MKRLDVAALLLIEVGLVMFIVGALSDSSFVGQLSAAMGLADPAARDLRWLGTLTMIVGVIVNFLEPHYPIGDSQSSTSWDSSKTNQISVCAVLLVGCFFLPWAQVMGFSASGFELMKLGSVATLTVLIPVAALLVLANNLIGFHNRMLVTAVGALPFLALAIGLAKSDGQGFRILSFGAYFVLIISAAMILIANELVELASSKLQKQRVENS